MKVAREGITHPVNQEFLSLYVTQALGHFSRTETMADCLGEDVPPRAGAGDYQDDNGKFPPSDPPVPTYGGRKSDIDEDSLDSPGTPTTGRRAVASHKLEQHLAEYDTRLQLGLFPTRSRRSADRPGLVYGRGYVTPASSRAGISPRLCLGCPKHCQT